MIAVTAAMLAGGLIFSPCDDAHTHPLLEGTQCARAELPLSPGAEDAVSIFVRRMPAAEPSRGEIWLVAGGPGESGAGLYAAAQPLREAFPDRDLVFPDHRGTGLSTRICPDEEAPGSPGGTALEGAEWRSCFGYMHAHDARTRAFSVTNAARDLAALSALSDADERHLYAVSYGTQLAVRLMHDSPDAFDGVVLDSLVPAEGALASDLTRRHQVADRIGRRVLSRCASDPDCASRFGGEGPEAAYRRLLAEDVFGDAGMPLLMSALLDHPGARAAIPGIIAAADGGEDHAPLLQGALEQVESFGMAHTSAPGAEPSLPLTMVVTASENRGRPDLDAGTLAAEEAELLFSSPLPRFLIDPAHPVYERDGHYGRIPARMPRTIALLAELDAKTPAEDGLAHAALLADAGEVSAILVTDAPHAVLHHAPACVTGAFEALFSGSEAEGRCGLQ
jgi:pimeloyl-ACP methyl ester carboxylesterase